MSKKEGRHYLVKLDVGHLSPQTADIIADKERIISQLEADKRILEERNQSLQEQIDILKERIKELEADKGFLLEQLREKDRQLAEKDRIINELIPRALPKPKRERGWLRRLFKRPKERGKKEEERSAGGTER